MKKITDRIQLVIMYILLFFIFYVLFSWIIAGFDGTRVTIFGYKPLHIVSASMEPTIMTSDYVLGKIIKPENVKVGDICTYILKDGLGLKRSIIHRVIEITPNGNFVFKGDNNEERDPLEVKPEQIRFKVVEKSLKNIE